MTLTDYIDILDHLEASGNVPAGYKRSSVTRMWTWYGIPFGRMDKEEHPLAIASLCHTTEGVLIAAHGHDGMRLYGPIAGGPYIATVPDNGEVREPSRLSAAAAAYRTQFGLEQP